MNRQNTDISLAHGLARFGLGINIALHGFTRLPNLGGFASWMREQFAGSILPSGLVTASAYGIAVAEAMIGTLLLLGLWLRTALVGGTFLMFTLLFGSCLIQNWNAAGSQMIYLGFFTVLLAGASYDRYSVDAFRKK